MCVSVCLSQPAVIVCVHHVRQQALGHEQKLCCGGSRAVERQVKVGCVPHFSLSLCVCVCMCVSVCLSVSVSPNPQCSCACITHDNKPLAPSRDFAVAATGLWIWCVLLRSLPTLDPPPTTHARTHAYTHTRSIGCSSFVWMCVGVAAKPRSPLELGEGVYVCAKVFSFFSR